jgi:reverse gyrase
MISEDRAEAAVEYLRDTATQYGQARGHQSYTEGNLRRIKALELLKVEGGLGEREAKAYASEAYREALEAFRDATKDTETIRALREAADLTIRVWQSQQANIRQGNI